MEIHSNTQLLLDHARAVFGDEARIDLAFKAVATLGHTDGLTIEQQALLMIPVLLVRARALQWTVDTMRLTKKLDMATRAAADKTTDHLADVRVVAPSTCRHCTSAIYKNEYGDWLAMTNGTPCAASIHHEPVERPFVIHTNCKSCGAIIENIGGMVWVAEDAQPCNRLVGHQPREAEV